jgi:hypothetical protein
MELWVGCVAGALEEREYRTLLADAGFTSIDLEVTRSYGVEDAGAFLANTGLDTAALAHEIDGKVVSAFIRATKPAAEAPRLRTLATAAASCCGPDCCR